MKLTFLFERLLEYLYYSLVFIGCSHKHVKLQESDFSQLGIDKNIYLMGLTRIYTISQHYLC